ncbi:MAG: hypothetical protein RL226_2306 [Bacteroidota bacterium]|jgi:hypothetical protein
MKYLCILFSLLVVHTSAQNLKKFGIDTTQVVPDGLAAGLYAPQFETLKKTENTTLVVFIKGSWHKKDMKFLARLADSLQTSSPTPVDVVIVTTEKPEYNGKMTDIGPFKVVNDADQSISTAWDNLFVATQGYVKRRAFFNRMKQEDRCETANGKFNTNSCYLVSPTGKILWRYFSLDGKSRPSVKEIVAAMKK